MEVLLLGQNFNQKFQTTVEFPFKDEGLREFRNSMSMVLDNEIYFGSQQWLRFHTWFIMTL